MGSKQAVQILFDDITPRFSERPGGYTRVLRLAKPRLGDAGVRAVLEFVGTHDRKRRKAAKPAFESEAPATETPADETPTARDAGWGNDCGRVKHEIRDLRFEI